MFYFIFALFSFALFYFVHFIFIYSECAVSFFFVVVVSFLFLKILFSKGISGTQITLNIAGSILANNTIPLSSVPQSNAGAIYAQQSTVSIKNSVITLNQGCNGGNIPLFPPSSPLPCLSPLSSSSLLSISLHSPASCPPF